MNKDYDIFEGVIQGMRSPGFGREYIEGSELITRIFYGTEDRYIVIFTDRTGAYVVWDKDNWRFFALFIPQKTLVPEAIEQGIILYIFRSTEDKTVEEICEFIHDLARANSEALKRQKEQ